MCVVSMIMDNGKGTLDEWYKSRPVPPYEYHPTPIPPITIDPDKMGGFNPKIKVSKNMTLSEWIEYFEQLIQLAKEFDEKTGQPECEDVVKKLAIDKIAKELGVTITL